MKYQGILKAPESYWSLDPETKKEICNGVGPKGYGFLFPDTIWGLDVSEAADIHDYMYQIGVTEEDRKKADKVFLDNMNAIIDSQSSWAWLTKLRKRRASLYYEAVSKFGKPAFLASKCEE